MSRLALTLAAVIGAGYAAVRWGDRAACEWANVTGGAE